MQPDNLKTNLQTLPDLRGSIAVDGPQDFEAICQQVISARAKPASHGE